MNMEELADKFLLGKRDRKVKANLVQAIQLALLRHAKSDSLEPITFIGSPPSIFWPYTYEHLINSYSRPFSD